MTSFFPIGECCLKGLVLPGEPKGSMELASSTRKITRYHAKPSQVIDDKAALVLFYDAFGFNIPNPKLMADRFAEELKINVFVPDYVPNAFGPEALDPILESYPGENKSKSWFSMITGTIYGMLKILPRIPKILQGRTIPLCEKALDDLQAEGYTKIGAVGYCLGGSQIITLLSQGDRSRLLAGVICHPSPDSVTTYQKITRPTKWLLASDDMRFKNPQIIELKRVFNGKKDVEFELIVYPETVHGFAARPNLGHEPTKKAFEQAGATTIDFLREKLLG